MRAELLVVPGCPPAAEAERRYRTALHVTGHPDVTVRVRILDTMVDAAAAGFSLSPTFRLDDVDLVPEPGADARGLACRRTIPTTSDLADAISPRPRRQPPGR